MTKINPDQPYEMRQIVATMGAAGEFALSGKLYKIPLIMTFWGGEKPSFAAIFDRIADRDAKGFLVLSNMKKGEIVVKPGLVYRKILMTGVIMNEHLLAMKRFRPKKQIVYEKSTEAPVDLGVIGGQ